MATSKSAQYWLRVAGNDNNGGGFDSGISGAGTNYADQDAAQLALTGLTCTVNGTTLTQTGGTFTSAMVGNAIQITGGTNFLKDIYWITAFTNSNNVVLDRTPATAGAGSAGTGNLGGALATLKCLSTSGTNTANPLNTTTQLVPGNTVNIRGGGTNDPGSLDYDFSGGYWVFPSGNTSVGPITLVGYNGRPYLAYAGLLLYSTNNITWRNLKFVITVASFTTHGAIYGAQLGINCIFDQNGNDAYLANPGGNGSATSGAINCEFRNSGSTAAGTQPAIVVANYFSIISDCWIHTTRGIGIRMDGPAVLVGNIINSCGDDGVQVGNITVYGLIMKNNTIDKNTGNGINFTAAAGVASVQEISGNLITNHTSASKYGVNLSFGSAGDNTILFPGYMDYNGFYNNSNGNYHTITTNISPSFVGTNDPSITGDPYTSEVAADLSLNNTASAGAAARGIVRKVGTTT